MKHSFLWLTLIFFGLVGFSVLILFQNITINNESEYYVLKEATKAAMYESIDKAYYRASHGKIKISEEKFVANCTRRFYASVSGTGKGYQLKFYDIMESPPKVSVSATSTTDSYTFFTWGEGNENNDTDFDIVNALSAILEHDKEGE